MWIVDDVNTQGGGAPSATARSRDWHEPRSMNCRFLHFRMRDEHGNVLFKGRSTSVYSRRPFDEFGVNAGCSEIQYQETGGGWTTL